MPKQIAPWSEIAADILAFFDDVPFLYDEHASGPLRVGGAWRLMILQGRARQADIVARRDGNMLAKMLERMFFNELCLGLQDYGYFGDQQSADPHFIAASKRLEFVTGSTPEAIATDINLPLWGIAAGDRILKYTDPSHAMQATTVHRLLERPIPIVADLGSGFGGMAEKLARLHNAPIDIWLIDIPPNLTTAYAYLCAMFGRTNVTLFGSAADVARVPLNDGRQRFLLAPSLFVEHLPPQIDVVHNNASLSEMDLATVAFYLDVLVRERAAYFVETNSNQAARNWDDHIEVRSSDFPVPETHRLMARYLPFDAMPNSRYLTSIYSRKASKVIFPPITKQPETAAVRCGV